MNKPDTFSPDYIISHGVEWNDDVFEHRTYYNKAENKYHYEQLFFKGTPFTGITYELFANGNPKGYSCYKDGYECGDNVDFFEDGSLSFINRTAPDHSRCFASGWHENGKPAMEVIAHRPDNKQFYIHNTYDTNGNIISKRYYDEMDFTYNYASPDERYKTEFYENGNFRSVRLKEPSPNDFYISAEYADDGTPVNIRINSSYAPLMCFPAASVRFDDSFRFNGDILEHDYGEKFLPYNGTVLFVHDNGNPVSSRIYHNGIPCGAQFEFYPSGQIKELYCIENGNYYGIRCLWDENGRLEEAAVYSYDHSGKLLPYCKL